MVFLLWYSVSIANLIAQPTKQWDNTLGGEDNELLNSGQQTTDGGYILAGTTYSYGISSDKSQVGYSTGRSDFWIIKLDANGNKEWDKIIGGTSGDDLNSIQQTTDGGFILGGISVSNISGDKSESSFGGGDYWVVKLDAAGNKVWDKTFGGTGQDNLISLQQTRDGGYILGGNSTSNAYQLGGKTENSKGYDDYWIVKLNANGTKEWDKTVGGNAKDELKTVRQTVDGGFIVGGTSESNISGDKSENKGGYSDYWVVKLNASGNKEWDNTLGGIDFEVFGALQATPDGGCILGGWSISRISGDKSIENKGIADFWVVKLNASGLKEWDNTYGGGGSQAVTAMQLTTDGGYILGGKSNSGWSFDKSENGRGGNDFWVVKINATGKKEWDKTLGGDYEDILSFIQQTDDGGYFMGGSSHSNLSGDKSESRIGTGYSYLNDYWVVKLSPSHTPERTITTKNLALPGFCIGGPLEVSFTTSGTFSPSEIFKVQLSDTTGSFASPITIGEGTASPIFADIPFSSNIPEGKGYRLRVVSTLSPAVIGTDNGTDLRTSVNVLGQPFFYGPSNPCSGTIAVYTASDPELYKNLSWDVPSGWTIVSGQGTSSITVKVGTTNGLITLSGDSFCGSHVGYNSVEPVVVPTQLTPITANTNTPCVGELVVYTAKPADQNYNYETGYYDWQLPSGWIIISGQWTNIITVKAGSAPGTISVNFQNSCGSSAPQTLAVASAISNAPTVTSKATCGPGPVTLTASGAPATGSYRWYTSNSTSTPVATTAIFTTPVLAATTTYYVSVVNGSCESTRVPVTATVNPLPKIVVTTNATTITSGGSATLTASGAGNYTWSPATGLSSTTGGSVIAKPTATTTYTVTGTDANGCAGTASLTITVNTSGLQTQTITFPPIPDKLYGDAPFTLNATSSSGLSLYYRIMSGPATLSGKTLTMTGVGKVTVRAYHPGNDRYLAATPVDVSFNVLSPTRLSQTISFASLPNKEYGDAPFTISATASSGLPVSFSVVVGGATISGNTVTLTDSGMVTIRASQAGNATYLAAPDVDRTFRVWGPPKMSQTINFPPLPKVTFSEPPFMVSATASSGLPVSFSILSGPATISGNIVTLTGAGIVTVRASQAGSGTYHTAQPVDQSFTVVKAAQTINFAPLADKTYGDAPVNLTATASSGLPVSFRVISGTVKLLGNTLYLLGAGTVTVQAEQPGDNNYSDATVVQRSFTVAKANQTINLAAIPDKTLGEAPFMQSATASSGLPLSYSIVSGPATIAGNVVTLTGVGTVTVRAAQAGDANYNSASTEKSFAVKSAEPQPTACSVALTSKITQAEPWYGMWGPTTGAGAIDLTVSGGTAPYTYQWSNGLTSQDVAVAAPGTYTVTLTDAKGCVARAAVTVGRKNDPIKLASSQINVSATGGRDGSVDLSVVGGIAPFTYRWSNGATTEDLTGLAAGIYTVTVTDAFGQKVSISVQILAPGQTALTATKNPVMVEEALVNNMQVYPNPIRNQATVNFSLKITGNYTLALYDSKGAKVKNISAGQAVAGKALTLELNVAGLAEGVYLLQLLTDKGLETRRISVSR
ncbi:hypothetical protein AAE02nite_18050 [Adhaeribacter aerolatus]|uniref:Ig-like domain-containing protein n=1 Tax=Adhaeribacter aerolatus TaxID=670289 RepID=A0A512AWP4_9BACT|nr:T9SS type A sorting domain-containing protein [Adhaeribacter aerolatus]GEO04141.1 hypothetical protein AAE02nite_18050 [Adhaeribacter aerolatus]